MRWQRVGILGVGLIGGSIGLALRSRGLAKEIVGFGPNLPTLQRAAEAGVIDFGTVDLDAALDRCEVVVICAPVDRIAPLAIRAARRCPPDALITDAGSTKATIARALADSPANDTFIGSHPLAGSEKRGWEHSRADLFAGRVCVLTPTPTTPPELIARARAFWESLGCEIRLMTPDDHDEALALTSHLPHFLASALAGCLPAKAAPLAASGFRDTTRTASGDPGLWSAIFRDNREYLCGAAELFRARFDQLLAALDEPDSDRLTMLLSQAKQVRDALGS